MQKEKPVPGIKSRLMKVFGATLALAILLLPSPAAAAAESYPVKPTRLIIAFAPGGSTDIIGRLIAQKLSERLGKQVVPENRAGGGGTIGAEMVAKSEPTVTRCCSPRLQSQSTRSSSKCRTIRRSPSSRLP